MKSLILPLSLRLFTQGLRHGRYRFFSISKFPIRLLLLWLVFPKLHPVNLITKKNKTLMRRQITNIQNWSILVQAERRMIVIEVTYRLNFCLTFAANHHNIYHNLAPNTIPKEINGACKDNSIVFNLIFTSFDWYVLCVWACLCVYIRSFVRLTVSVFVVSVVAVPFSFPFILFILIIFIRLQNTTHLGILVLTYVFTYVCVGIRTLCYFPIVRHSRILNSMLCTSML